MVIPSREGREQHVDARENMIRAVEFQRTGAPPAAVPVAGAGRHAHGALEPDRHRRPRVPTDPRRVGVSLGPLGGQEHGPGQGASAARAGTRQRPSGGPIRRIRPSTRAWKPGSRDRGQVPSSPTSSCCSSSACTASAASRTPCVDLALERERIEELADRIVEFDLGIIEEVSRRFPGMIDALGFTDDWGTESALFIDPRLWREFFMPRYRRIFDACHDAGWHVWMHSCGRVNAIIPSLVEIGVNVLDLQQPRALGIEEIGAAFAGKVCFSSLCDIQKTLPRGTPRGDPPRGRRCCSMPGPRTTAGSCSRTTATARPSGRRTPRSG